MPALLGALLLLAAIMLAGCGGDSAQEQAPAPTAATQAATAAATAAVTEVTTESATAAAPTADLAAAQPASRAGFAHGGASIYAAGSAYRGD